MVSNIDPTFPVAGVDQPSQGFRDNFQAAKTEIEALQTDVSALQSNPVVTVLNDIGDVDTTTTPPNLNDVLTFNGTEWVPQVQLASSALQNVVEDTTPQLGGDLDVNQFNITVDNINSDTIDLVGRVRVVDDNTTQANSNLQMFSNNPGEFDANYFSMRRSRGSLNSPNAVETNDFIGDFAIRGHDGSSYARNFFIRTIATENHSVSNHGTTTTFSSSADGSSTTSVRLRIDQNGQLVVNEAAGLYILSNNTTDATLTELFINGTSGSRLVLPDDTTWFFRVDVVARRTDVNDESAAFSFEGAIDRNVGAGTTALVGAVTGGAVTTDTTAWVVTVDADNGNGTLRVTVNGEAAKNISWVAKIETVQVTG